LVEQAASEHTINPSTTTCDTLFEMIFMLFTLKKIPMQQDMRRMIIARIAP